MNYNYDKYQLLALLFFAAAVFFGACTFLSGFQISDLAEQHNELVGEYNQCVKDYNALLHPRKSVNMGSFLDGGNITWS